MAEQELRIKVTVDKQTGSLKTVNSELNNLESSTKKTTDSSKQLKDSTNALSNAYSKLKVIIASAIAVGTVREYAKTSDAMALLEARIKLVSKESDNYADTQKDLVKIAQENRTAYSSVGELYARLSPAMKTLNADTKTVIGVTDAYSKSLLVSGASVEESMGATRQFSQAMASGVLRGEEFNSMMENAPRAMRVLTETLGKTQGELRKMAENGELASGIVAGALLMSLSQLRDEASKMPNTISGEFQRIQNEAALTVEVFNKLTGANAYIADNLSIVTKKLVEFRSTMDPDQLKQYLGYIVQAGEAYVVYKVSVEAAKVATSGINSLMETFTKITTAKTAATVAATEAERLGSIAIQTRTLADLARQEAQSSGLISLEKHAAMLEKEAIASSVAAKSATIHAYELQGVASKAGVASMAMSGLTTAFKTFAPTAILFGITEIFLNWDKITGNVKNNLITASDQLEKMTNNQLDVQANNLKKAIQDVNKELLTNEAVINSSRKAGEARTKENGYGSFIMTDEQLTKAKAQVDTLNQEKDKFEKTLNEIDQLRKNNTAKKVADLDAFTKAERGFREEVNKSELDKFLYEEGQREIKAGEETVANTKRIKESTASINTQIASLEKQYGVQKEIQNLNVESSLIAEKVTKPEAEYLKEVSDIKAQIAKNQATINLLNSKEYDKNDTSADTDKIKDLEKINELKQETELLIRKETAAEEKKNATIKAGNEELKASIYALNLSDTDKQYQDLAKTVSDLIKDGKDLKLVGEYASTVADQIKRNDAYNHLQTELEIRTQIAEVGLYGAEKETELESIRHESVVANLAKELDAKKLNDSEYFKLLEIENQRHAQNADAFYQFMLESFDNINKALDENFFDAISGKFKSWGSWLKEFFKSIGTSVAQGLSRTLAGSLTNTVQSGVVNLYKTYGGLSASSSLVGTTVTASDVGELMNNGGTFNDATNTITTAGGTAVKLAEDGSGTVEKSGSDILSIASTISSIKTAYEVMTVGITGSIITGFQTASGVLATLGAESAATGLMSFGVGVANPFAYASVSGLPTAMTIGSGLSAGLIGAGVGYGVGWLGDKLFGADTYAGTVGAIGGALGGIGASLGLWGGPVGILVGSVLGSVLGGIFGKTKVTGSGIEILGNATAEDAAGRYYTSYKKKSWFSSKSWTTYTGFSDEEIAAIEKTIGAYDYMLAKLGEYDDLVVAGGRFSNLQEFLDTNVVKAFLTSINPNDLDTIYQSWVDYAEEIDTTIAEAISTVVSGYITDKRDYTEWLLGDGTLKQLSFTSSYLKSDFEALAESLGASGVTVDNFLSMYDAAVKNNFTQENIEAWQNLGDMLTASTDAAKKYKESLASINDGIKTTKQTYTEWLLGKGTTEQLAYTSNYLKSDVEALAASLGASGVTVDNFLSMYDAAIKKDFTEETIKAWTDLGDALMNSTDAAKAYQDALDSLNSSTSYSLPEDMLLKNVSVSESAIDLSQLVSYQQSGNSMYKQMLSYLYEIVKTQKTLLDATKFSYARGIPA